MKEHSKEKKLYMIIEKRVIQIYDSRKEMIDIKMKDGPINIEIKSGRLTSVCNFQFKDTE